MKTKTILRLKKSNCKNCHKCIRYCPVKAIRFSAGQANVIEDECILCGQCFEVCPQNAKEIRNDIESVKVMVSQEQVMVSIAPSFAAAFPDVGIEGMREALRKLGFKDVQETAIGAAIVKTEYERILREEKPNILISSCCTSINLLMRKHFPDTLFALAPVVSPAQAHCLDMKSKNPGIKTVFIGPCIAKKYEATEDEAIDAVLSFTELCEWFDSEGIVPEHRPDTGSEGKTRLFPTTGGVIGTMEKNPDYTYLAVDGLDKCLEVLEEVRAGSLHRCFIELSACMGSCANGPLMPKRAPAANTANILKYTRPEEFCIDAPHRGLITRTPQPIQQSAALPPEWEIDEMLMRIGKENPEDRLNCGPCGYNTCRDKAIAVIQGKAEQSMCLPYMTAKAEGFSDTVVDSSPNGILVLNDDFEVQKINPVACKLLRVRNPKDVLGENVTCLFDPAIFTKARVKPKKPVAERTYMAEYGCYVDRTILYNPEYHLFICILRDVTGEMDEQEKKMEMRMQAVDIANDVAKKQLKIVQDIASLLGETAADTLIAIERLKETISDE